MTESRWYAFSFQNNWEEKILIQCYCKLLNTPEAVYRNLGKVIMIELTKPQYIELNAMYTHYRQQWSLELEHYWIAFINVYDLFAEDTPVISIPTDQLELMTVMIPMIGANDANQDI